MALLPPGRRTKRTERHLVANFTLGAVAGGSLTGFALWALSGSTEPIRPRGALFLVGIAVLAAVVHDWRYPERDLPGPRRQVPQSVFEAGLGWASLRFGFEMGTGVRTYLTSTLPYVAAVTIVAIGPSWYLSLTTGAAFGVGRAMVLASRLWAGDREAWSRRLRGTMRGASRLVSLTGGATAVWLAATTAV